MQASIGELGRRPAIKEGRIEGNWRKCLIRSHLGADPPGMVALAEPACFVDFAALTLALDPAAINAKLLGPRHMLGDPAIAAPKMLFLFVRVHRGNELDVEREGGLIRLEQEAMTAQPFKDLNMEGTDCRGERVRAHPPRYPKIVLPIVQRDASEAVHTVAVRMPGN